MSAVEKSVKAGDKRRVRRSVVNRGSDNKPVSLLKLRCKLIYNIVKYAFAVLEAGSAGDASAYVFVSDLNNLGCRSLWDCR